MLSLFTELARHSLSVILSLIHCAVFKVRKVSSFLPRSCSESGFFSDPSKRYSRNLSDSHYNVFAPCAASSGFFTPEQLSLAPGIDLGCWSRCSGVLCFSSSFDSPLLSGASVLPRKEVIQPHLPIRLPCYDFTPVIWLTFGSWLLAVTSLTSGAPNSHGVTGGVYKARERIHRGMLIRDY